MLISYVRWYIDMLLNVYHMKEHAVCRGLYYRLFSVNPWNMSVPLAAPGVVSSFSESLANLLFQNMPIYVCYHRNVTSMYNTHSIPINCLFMYLHCMDPHSVYISKWMHAYKTRSWQFRLMFYSTVLYPPDHQPVTLPLIPGTRVHSHYRDNPPSVLLHSSVRVYQQFWTFYTLLLLT